MVQADLFYDPLGFAYSYRSYLPFQSVLMSSSVLKKLLLVVLVAGAAQVEQAAGAGPAAAKVEVVGLWVSVH